MRRSKKRIGNVPDDIGSIQWEDSLSAKREDAAYEKACKELQLRWDRWHAAKRLIDDDWKRQAELQLAAVTDSVEAGMLLCRLEDERTANEQADAVTTENYVNELEALIARQNALFESRWRKQAQKRLSAATKKVDRSNDREIARKERLLFFYP